MSRIRVSVQAQPAQLASWLELARQIEAAGFDALLSPDHPGSGPEPWQGLAAAAAVTSRLRLGTYVVQAGVRQPHHIAAEALTLDLLATGRVILGIGAGHTPTEWAAVGRQRPSPGERVSRLVETVDIVQALLAGNTVDFDGDHLSVEGAALEGAGSESGDITLLIGGNNRRLLEFAAQRADIVGLSGLGRTLADGHRHEVRWRPDHVRSQLDVVHSSAAAAGRTPQVEVLVQHVEVTEDREAALAALVADLDGLTVDEAARAPYLLVGTHDQIVAQLHRQAQEHGITRCVIRAGAVRDITPVLPDLR